MQYLWSKNEVYKKHGLTLRLCSGQRKGATTKSNKIRIDIWDFNYKKSLCVQQNILKIMSNFWVEKKRSSLFLKVGLCCVTGAATKKCFYNSKTHKNSTFSTRFQQPFENAVTCSFIRFLHALPKQQKWPALRYLKFTSMKLGTYFWMPN